MSDFQQKLILSIVDKVVLGIILLVAAHYFARLLERYKSNVAFRAELTRRRVEKISEVWSELYAVEAIMRQLFQGALQMLASPSIATETVDPSAAQTELESLLKIATRQHLVASVNLDKARFWIEDELYARLTRYRDALEQTWSALQSAAPTRVSVVREQLDGSRPNVLSYMNELGRGA